MNASLFIHRIPLSRCRPSSLLDASRPLPFKYLSTPCRSITFIKVQRQDSEFDNQWRKLNGQEREQLRQKYSPYNEQDWNALTLDQKKALYTIAFDLPPLTDSNESAKVFFVVAGVVVGSAGLLYSLMTIRGSSPTWTREHDEKRREYLRIKNDSFSK